jgi:citrate lyase subunit beta / citryl-CoA lyase
MADDQIALRSLLFVPATNPRRMEKAVASAADAVIIDLEDAVAVAEKPAAREAAAQFLQSLPPRPVFVRVNALSTSFCFDDVLAVAPANLHGIILPKVESALHVGILDWLLAQIETKSGKPASSIEILPILETAQGIAASGEIARASSRLRRLAFGAVDLALDMELDLDDESGPIAQARFALALASRQAGLEGPLDTAFVDIANLDRLRASAIRARAMGFQGKMCIHPAQIDTVNAVFTPSEAELERARRIVAAFEQAEASGAAAVAVDGVMVDYPVVAKARRILATAREGR